MLIVLVIVGSTPRMYLWRLKIWNWRLQQQQISMVMENPSRMAQETHTKIIRIYSIGNIILHDYQTTGTRFIHFGIRRHFQRTWLDAHSILWPSLKNYALPYPAVWVGPSLVTRHLYTKSNKSNRKHHQGFLLKGFTHIIPDHNKNIQPPLPSTYIGIFHITQPPRDDISWISSLAASWPPPTASPNLLQKSSLITGIDGENFSHNQASQKHSWGRSHNNQNNQHVIIFGISEKISLEKQRNKNFSMELSNPPHWIYLGPSGRIIGVIQP